MKPAHPRAQSLMGEWQFHLEWLRGAVGRWYVADEPPAPLPRATPSNPAAHDAIAVGMGAAVEMGALSRGAPDRGAGDLDALAAEVAACTRCALCQSRTQTVFGVGARAARLVVVGEAPGAEEDRRGEPFVGPAGELLDRMLGAIGLGRQEVYICNVVKCRPPGNRNPQPGEIGACRPFLDRQLDALQPELILALGNVAARTLLQTARGITSLRGRVAKSPSGWRVLPSFHPAYLLRNPSAKREAWEDLKRAASLLGLAVPGRPAAPLPGGSDPEVTAPA